MMPNLNQVYFNKILKGFVVGKSSNIYAVILKGGSGK